MSWKKTHYNTSNYVLVCLLGLISLCILHLCISIAMPEQWLLAYVCKYLSKLFIMINIFDLFLVIVKRHLDVFVITMMRRLLFTLRLVDLLIGCLGIVFMYF
jgi:hypothetical protein